MPRFTHFTSSEKLQQAIWCEIFVVTEGYIPYLRKWIKLQDSPKAKTKADQSVSEVHSNIQRLAPVGSSEVGDSQNSPNQMTQHDHWEGRINNSQVKLQTQDEEESPK